MKNPWKAVIPMATRTISFSLDSASIGNAIAEIRRYQDEFRTNCERLRRMVAERIQWSAQQGFNSAVVSDVIYGAEPPASDVQVRVEDSGDVTIVFADGEQAVFIEFGSGVFHNGAAGGSPHPWGPENGFLIGQYGLGNGSRKAWGYYAGGDKKSLVVTRGTPAAMPMYRGVMEASQAIGQMVQEVFG